MLHVQVPYGMATNSMMPFMAQAPPLGPGFMMLQPHAMQGSPMMAPYGFAPAMPGTA